jgi:hypothetical protein
MISIRKVPAWCAAAERVLGPTLDSSREAIVADVNAGRCELFEVNGGAAWVVTSASLDDQELCICCVAGEGLAELSTALVNIAGTTGLRRVRFFTKRPALKRLLRHLPIKLDGYVFTCEVPNAQRKPIQTNTDRQQQRH